MARTQGHAAGILTSQRARKGKTGMPLDSQMPGSALALLSESRGTLPLNPYFAHTPNSACCWAETASWAGLGCHQRDGESRRQDGTWKGKVRVINPRAQRHVCSSVGGGGEGSSLQEEVGGMGAACSECSRPEVRPRAEVCAGRGGPQT